MDSTVLSHDAVRNAAAGAWEYLRADDRAREARWRFHASPELKALLGIPAGAANDDDAQTWMELLEREDVPAFRAALSQCLQGLTDKLDVVFRVRHRSGRIRTLRARGRVERAASGRLRRVVGLTWDITEFFAARQRSELITRVFDSAVGGLVICDGTHQILEANQTLADITGHSLRELLRMNFDQVVFADTAPEVVAAAWEQVQARGAWVGKVAMRGRDGTAYRLEVRLACAISAGHPSYFSALVFDLESVSAVESTATSRTDYSYLGSSTVAEIGSQIGQAIKEAVGMRNGLAVFVLAIDRFDAVIETFGRERAEQILRACAERLPKAVATTVFCERLPSDRFVLVVADLLEERDVEHAFARITEVLSRDISLDSRSLRLTASAGTAVFPIDGVSGDLLLQRAESALEEARRRGRPGGSLQAYAPELSDYASDRIHIEASLRKALKLGAFECHLQPKVRLEDQRWVGAEALIRWRIGDAWISPSRFIPIAEESGLIKDLGRWILWEAASRVSIWRREGLVDGDFRIAVNLAGAQLETDLLRTVRAVLGYTQLPSSALMLELTETIIISNPKRARSLLDELRHSGVRISLDDFGTGYTSMSQLQSLAIDEIKIDQSFIRGLPDDESSNAIVRSLITLAHGLKLDVVAEGIETEAQRAALMKLGCRYGQGFLFSKAVPHDEFERALQGSRRERGGLKAVRSEPGRRDAAE